MTAFLVFSLWAPVASFGEIAVGERRPGLERPGRAALLGLLGAALGVERADDEGQQALEAGYGLAVRVDAPGRVEVDYHTAQVPPARRGKRWPTRRAELTEPDLETILSWRDSRTDAAFTVAAWARTDARWSLERIGQALARPMFRLSLGRRACPLGLPVAARMVEAQSLAEAFAARDRDRPKPEQELYRRLQIRPGRGPVHADVDAERFLGTGLRLDRRVTRRDRIISRHRWQFGLRDEIVALPVDGPAP